MRVASTSVIMQADIEWMGYTVRSRQWRFTSWHPWNGADLCPLPSNRSLVELYDHSNDTAVFDLDIAEYVNEAVDHPDVVANLERVLLSKVQLCHS